MPSAFETVALLIALTAGLGFLNARVVRLPHSIGLLLMGLVASLLLIGLDLLYPELPLSRGITSFVRGIDFQKAVMEGMLAFLLFAGALHVDISALRDRAWPVGLMATIGVLVSTAVVGLLAWVAARLVGVALPLPWAFVFGALISPTDPVAVLSTLKTVRVPESLEVGMSGESLFNDGVGVVVFTAVLAIAAGGTGEVGMARVAELFAVEALGGALLGLVAGFAAYRAMRAIDNYPVEVLLTLALVMGTYALAARLHTSGPIAMVVAGLLIGNRGRRLAMSDETQRYVFAFWTVVDEVLNSLLFLLIGLEVLVMRFAPEQLWLGLLAIPASLLARWLAVVAPMAALRRWIGFVRGTAAVLTWGGLRGGISVALALSLPETPEKAPILAATYCVVVFTIVVQGLSLPLVVRRSVPGAA